MTRLEAHIAVNAPLDTDRRVERLTDGRAVIVPAVITAQPLTPNAKFPDIAATVDVVDGSVVVTKVELIGSADAPIDSTAVRNWSLPRLAQLAARSMTLKVDSDGGYEFDDTDAASEIVTAAVKKRSSAGPDRLNEVAVLFNRGGVQAVQDSLFVSRSQAYRLIKQARAAGRIEGSE
jgi:hypothetical protein